jgi:serine/threonine protein kinase
MPAPANIDDLVKLIRKSGILQEAQMDSWLEKLRLTGALPSDVKKLAGAMVKDGLLTYFQAEQFLLGKSRGFEIGKYRLLERIGFGGMGQVFLCEHLYMRRRVAIKVLPPAKAEEPAALGRFYREARAAAALDHGNIVRTHDIDQDGNLHFLVMEYVDGSSLLDIVKKMGPMDVKRATNYIWQSIQGLDHAFRVGVIHRDVKPGNILVDRFGSAKILDMGLARFYYSDDDMLTLKYDEKSVLGTADYVAPEQTVNSHDVDVRADIYSLGATFYFLLAGHPPYPDGTIAQKLIAHQTREPTPIRQIRPEVPEGVALVLRKMLARSVEDRFQTPEDVYQALLPFVDQQIAPPPDEEMPQLSLAARDHSGMSSSATARQDLAVLRGEMKQRSGRTLASSSGRASAPTAMATPSGHESGRHQPGSSPVRDPHKGQSVGY